MNLSTHHVKILKSRAYEFLQTGIYIDVNENFLAQAFIIKDEINEELIKYLARHPHAMCDLATSKFENLVAELMRDIGYDVSYSSNQG